MSRKYQEAIKAGFTFFVNSLAVATSPSISGPRDKIIKPCLNEFFSLRSAEKMADFHFVPTFNIPPAVD